MPNNKKTILIVDDNPNFLRMMQVFLEKSNYKVITASGGKEGLEKAKLQPNLILLDVRMPDMEGPEVCRHLKKSKETRDIPIIIITVFRQMLEQLKASDLGAVDCVSKDLPFEDILSKIKSTLGNK